MGRFLAKAGQEPDLVLTSPALRARDTADRVKRHAGWTCSIEIDDQLYGTGPAEVVARLRAAIPDGTELVVAVGHEPTWSALAELLSGARVGFPTGAAARFQLDLHRWSQLSAGTGRLLWLVSPRLLDGPGSDQGR